MGGSGVGLGAGGVSVEAAAILGVLVGVGSTTEAGDAVAVAVGGNGVVVGSSAARRQPLNQASSAPKLSWRNVRRETPPLCLRPLFIGPPFFVFCQRINESGRWHSFIRPPFVDRVRTAKMSKLHKH